MRSKKAQVPIPPVLIFLGIIFIVGVITMSWLPGILEENFNLSKSWTQTIGTLVLLVTLAVLHRLGWVR